MIKRKTGDGLTPMHTTIQAAEPFSQIGDHDMIYSQWWTRIRRTIANFFTDRAKRLHESSDVEMPLTITEQINLFDQLQRMGAGTGDRRYGSYPQEPVRHRANVAHLVRRAGKEVKDADFRDPDGPGDQSDDQSR
jgi:hypothetical protein